MTLALLSLVGVPPLAGFAGKFLLFGAVMDAHFTWLAGWAVLNSVLALAVYLRIIVPMYRPSPDRGAATAPHNAQTPLLANGVWLVATIATLGLGLAAQSILGAVG